MKIKTADLIGIQLDWAVAKCEGYALRSPVRASNADVESLTVPFTLYECNYHFTNESDDRPAKVSVEPIRVERYGINHEVGATAPSITFRGSDGRKALASVDMFYLDKTEAEVEAKEAMVGGLEDFHPSTNWVQGGPIIDREVIDTESIAGGADGWVATKFLEKEMIRAYGPNLLIAGMRCYTASKLGDEVEIPEELA